MTSEPSANTQEGSPLHRMVRARELEPRVSEGIGGGGRRFRVMKDWHCKLEPPRDIPWDLIAPHEEYALKYHGGQSLERLNQRGGLSPDEIWHVVNHKEWVGVERASISAESAVEWVKTWAQSGAQGSKTMKLSDRLGGINLQPGEAHERRACSLRRLVRAL